MRYGMVIDLPRCVGCDACAVACKQTHGTAPGVFWSHVEREEVGIYPHASTQHTPVLCNHCENAPCVKVCPVGATMVSEGGIVTVDKQACIGCRYCLAACPYDARHFQTNDDGYWPELERTAFEKSKEGWHETGTVEKCVMCEDRVAAGRKPACVQACPAKARFFGDLDDPSSEVSLLVKDRAAYGLQEDLGTKPKVYYIS